MPVSVDWDMNAVSSVCLSVSVAGIQMLSACLHVPPPSPPPPSVSGLLLSTQSMVDGRAKLTLRALRDMIIGVHR